MTRSRRRLSEIPLCVTKPMTYSHLAPEHQHSAFAPFACMPEGGPISSWADSTVGWVSDSVTHAGIGFRSSTATYGVLRLIATAYLQHFESSSRCVDSVAPKGRKASNPDFSVSKHEELNPETQARAVHRTPVLPGAGEPQSTR